MCGICGVVSLGNPPETATARAMLARLRHRGPDGEGVFADDAGVALCHARLAIIDLTDGGRQPFASEDGSRQLLHNGEIFNYVELRRELEAHGYRFRTHTDTEVVLHAFDHWGDDCVHRFNGMWAITLWDSRRRRLWCSRDRFGIKPFAYRWDGARFVFASEPQALLADPRATVDPDLDAIRDFIEQGYVDHRDGTFFAGIEQLPPGALARRRRDRSASQPLVEPRTCRRRRRRRRDLPRPLRRRGAPASPQRRAARNGALGRTRLVGGRRDDRPPAPAPRPSRPGRSGNGSRRSPSGSTSRTTTSGVTPMRSRARSRASRTT